MRKFAQFSRSLMVAVLSAHTVPAVLNYAGQVAVNGQPFDGQGLFKFALVNADGNTTYWSNDGTSANGSEPSLMSAYPSMEDCIPCFWATPRCVGHGCD